MSNPLFKNTTYEIASLILAKDKPFTLEEIQKELDVEVTREVMKIILKRLRDAGIIYEHGSYYQLNV